VGELTLKDVLMQSSDWILAPAGRVWAASGGEGSHITEAPAPPHPVGNYFEALRAEARAHDGILDESDLTATPDEIEYALRHEGKRWRVAVLRSLSGWHRVMRYFPDELPEFTQMGYPEKLTELMLDERLTSGLVIFSGPPAAWKTTAAAAYISALLRGRGGHAITLEDPPEPNLEGEHGQGRCLQIEARRETMAEQLVHALRYGDPTVLMLGEIRDGATMAEALRAGINGHYIVMTMHSSGVGETMERIRALAMETGMNAGAAASLMAASISLVVHQRLFPLPDGEGAGSRFRLSAHAMILTPPWGTVAMRAHIEHGEFRMLGSEIHRQAQRLRLPPPPPEGLYQGE